VFDDVRPRIATALENALREGASDSYELQRVMRRAVGRWVSDTHRRRPMIIPVVVEV
jgi:ribonuclease J